MTDTDGPYSLLPIEGGEVRLLLGAEDDPATVDNCDGFVVDGVDGSTKSFTIITLAAIDRVMSRRESSGEGGSGSHLRVPDLIVLRSCRLCGKPGEEIDHLVDDSDNLANLQLLCKTCHHGKTAERMVPASAEQKRWIAELIATRVTPGQPRLLADDEIGWQTGWRALKKGRRERLTNQMVEAGLVLADFRGASRAEMVDALTDVLEESYADEDFEEYGNYFERLGDDDSGYGPNSYFAHAMAKDD